MYISFINRNCHAPQNFVGQDFLEMIEKEEDVSEDDHIYSDDDEEVCRM